MKKVADYWKYSLLLRFAVTSFLWSKTYNEQKISVVIEKFSI